MLRLFTWWNGVTLGGLFDIKRRSQLVGTDEYGNKYYEDRKVSIERCLSSPCKIGSAG